MTKNKKIFITLGAVVLSVFVLLAVLTAVEIMFDSDPVENFMLFLSRPSEGSQMPDFSEGVTNIRVTTVDRNISWIPTLAKNEVFNTRVYKQIYYGYYSDGTWVDLPCENYELRALGNSRNDYEASDRRHVVKIDKYVLLAFPVGVSASEKSYGVVTDSLKSEVIELTEYGTSGLSMPDSGKKCYGRIRENPNVMGILKSEHEIVNGFAEWYYIVLEYDNIPKDYVVSVSEYIDTNDQEPMTYTYTYDDIMEALNRK